MGKTRTPHAWLQDLWHAEVDPEDGTPECTGCKRPRGQRLWPKTGHGSGSRWQVNWYGFDGKKQRKNRKTKPEAEALVAEINAKLSTGQRVDLRARAVTLAEYAPKWMTTLTCGDASKEAYERRLRLHILPVLGSSAFSELDRDDVKTFLAGLKLGDAYANQVFATLAALMSAAAYKGYCAVNPCAQVGRRGDGKVQITPWSDERLYEVLRALDKQWPRYTAAALVGACAGLRQGEIFGLAVEDIDEKRGQLYVRRQVAERTRAGRVFKLPKEEKSRTVRLSPELAEALRQHQERFPPRRVTLPWYENGRELSELKRASHTLLFTGERLGRVVHKTFFNPVVWKGALDLAGIKREDRRDGMHALRHFFARTMLDSGAQIEEVSAELGHTDRGFTLRMYGHLRPVDEGSRVVKAASVTGRLVLGYRD